MLRYAVSLAVTDFSYLHDNTGLKPICNLDFPETEMSGIAFGDYSFFSVVKIQSLISCKSFCTSFSMRKLSVSFSITV